MNLKVRVKKGVVKFWGEYELKKTDAMPFSEMEKKFMAAVRESNILSSKLYCLFLIANRMEQVAIGKVEFLDKEPDAPVKAPVAIAVEQSYSRRDSAPSSSEQSES